MQQQADLDLLHVKCEEESRCAGSFQIAFGGINDDLETSKMDLVTNLNIEMPVKKRKMNKKNKKKSKSTKEILDIVTETGQTKYGVSGAKPLPQSSKEKVDNPVMNCEKCLKNSIPLVSSTSLCAVQMNGCLEDPNIHSSNTSTCCNSLNMDRRGPIQSHPSCLIEVSQESLSSRNLSQCKSCESTNFKPGNGEVSNSARAVTECNGFKCNNSASQFGANKTRHQPHIMVGKENRHQVWQKSQRSARESQRHGNGLHCKYVEKDVSLLRKNDIVKNNSFLSRGLLPSPLITSSRHDNAANIVENSDMKIYARGRSKIVVESHRWTAQQKLNRNLDQCVSQPSQVSNYELEDCQGLQLELVPSFKAHNNFKSKKGQKCHGENFLLLQDKYCFSRKEIPQVPHEQNYYKNSDLTQRPCNSQLIVSHGAYCLHSSPASSAYEQQSTSQFTKSTEPVQGGFQPYSEMEIPVMNHVLGRSFHSSTDSEPYTRFNQFNEHALRKDITSGMNAKKWVPVGTKESRMLEKTCSTNISNVNNGDLPFLYKGVDDNKTEGTMINLCASAVLSKSKSTSSTSCNGMNSVESEVLKSESASEVPNVERSEVRESYAKKAEDNQQLIICSMVTKSLSAAYNRQLVSESAKSVMSYPLAEFERFIHAATPVIASSYAYENCSVCLHDQLTNCFLCKHQIPNTSLCLVWNWYEKPGNYGLKIKMGDSQNLNGLLTESMSSHAYFVPYLSAIQLFGYSNPSNSPGLDHFGSFISAPVCSNNRELVFQFLESEKPHQRKPLFNKILDLIDPQTSNLQVLGDSSKLKSLKLCDLHPASWFSVAWYPIYRIPDRNFRASFLTYHSLGHLAQRHVPIDSLDKKSFCVVSPVVGMQSYNAKGEGWFDLKDSEMLREKLEENASLFFRNITKDGKKKYNHQLDYEFFSSRKC